MRPEATLAGRRILILRPARRGERLARLLRERGAVPDTRPAITFEAPADPAPSTRAAAALEEYDWVVVTSPTGVDSLLDRLGDRGLPEAARFAAIGPGTARRLEHAGRAPDVVAHRSDSTGLAEVLGAHVRSGQRVLVVRPEAASGIVPERLRAIGAKVEPVSFYRTVPHPDVSRVVRDLLAAAYDAVVFTSPSSLHAVLGAVPEDESALRDALAGIRRVAIGAATAGALADAGMPAHAVAARPTDEAVADALVESFRGRSDGGALC